MSLAGLLKNLSSLWALALVIGIQTSFAGELSRPTVEAKAMAQQSVKIVALLAKRDGISRSQFREHYENNHVPLAKGVFEGWPGYVRNHIDKVYPPQPLDFDVLTMFWYRDLLHLQSTVELLNGDRGKVIREDETKFMSKATNRYYQVAESGAALIGQTQRPWNAGFQMSTLESSKIIALARSTVAGQWLATIENFNTANKPEALLSWVNNHLVDAPEHEFAEISELWFDDPVKAEALISKWHAELPDLIFLSVSSFESSTL